MFIDANIYLDLYQIPSGKKLLAFLQEQHAHIFVSQQIVDEVERNKLNVANEYFNKLAFSTINVPNQISMPDHLLGISDDKIAKLRQTVEGVKGAIKELREHAADILKQIGRSEDDVSKCLRTLFDSPTRPTPDQMKRAGARKEVGNPPGKKSDPLGDQISWEQFLDYCRDHKVTKVWIISKDGDYRTECIDGSFVVNPMLQRELKQTGVEEIQCIVDLLDAGEDFARNAGVTVKTLPTEAEKREIWKQYDAIAIPTLYSNIVLTTPGLHVGSPIFGSQSMVKIFDATSGKEDG